MSLITAQNVHRGYTIGKKRIEVLRGIDLSIEAGEKIFLCGPSGAGKTTLMYTLAGLERPEQGTVTVEGTNLYGISKNKQAKLRNATMSYIFQNFNLMPELTALENVMIPALIGGRDAAAAAKTVLERVGLGHRLDHLPAELSGGEQQRVSIARALINKPKLVFADEPTGNLDSKNGDQIMQLLIELTTEDNTALVVVTHDTSLATLGDRTYTVVDGTIEQQVSL
ncbi:ABC transporter ATP-binding protein [Rubritalea marina]|uniref:ABC transporter ATP-binding protein n=1 Tax=Rubritalea marina TaxID=361055 RepID=UPI000379371B|nr:ABC transporter ATP-binding protein [Rubritalea marina]